MKTAIKKYILYVLAAFFAVCVGALAFVSIGNIKTVNADDPTEVYLTLHHANPTQYQNNASNANQYWTSLCFLHTDNPEVYGVSSGASTGKDFSDITAKTTYTGSANTVSYTNANEWGWGADMSTSTFRFIYLKTVNAPTAGDKITISAGAWFITGGTINEKYILSEDVILSFNGTAWLDLKPFTLDGTDVWSGADQSGDNGAQLTAWGIANDGGVAAYPTSGTYAFLTAGGAMASAASANYASNITGIKYNGTPINEISGAVVAEWINRLNIYVPYTSGIITIEKGTIVGSAYAADDYYFSLAQVSGKNYGRMTMMNFAETTAYSLNETGTGIVWNGSNSGGVEIFGIPNNGLPPATGACNLINVSNSALLTHNIDNNLIYAPAGKTILCDGTPLSEISGSYIGIAYGYIFIYVPSDDSIITVQAGTRLGQGYYADKDYTYHFKKGANQSSLCYLVDFDSDGGTAVSSVYVHNGATVSEPTAPTKDSTHIFDYWYATDENVEFDFSTAITEDTTLTAKWREAVIYTVTFDTKGGSEVAARQVEQGTAVAAPDNPTRDADIFEYWYLEDENVAYNFSAPVTENITLNAKWTVRTSVDLTVAGIHDVYNNRPIGNPALFYLTRVIFDNNVNTGVKEEKNFTVLTANTTYTPSGDPVAWSWLCGNDAGHDPNDSAVSGIYLKTTTMPSESDRITVSKDTWFLLGGTDDNKYVLKSDMVLSFNGTYWIVGEYVPPTETNVTFSGLGSFNNAQINSTSNYFTQLVFTSAITSGGLAGMDYSNLIANTTYKDKDGNAADVTWNYISGFYFTGADKPVNYILFFTDKATMPSDGDTVTISSGAWFMVGGDDNNKYILTEEVEFVFMGEWIYNYDGLQDVEFVAVHFDWNNVRNYSYSDTNVVRTLLVYNQDLGSALNANNHVLASKLITVNGVRLSEISGATVDYSLGQTYVMITLPESALIPTVSYPITKLEITAGTPFENSKLPALTLSLIGGAWVVGEFPEYALSDSGYITVSDIAGKSSFELKGGNYYLSAIDDEDVDFRFVLTSADFKGVAYLAVYLKCSESSWDGFRFEFTVSGTGYVINVYDATAGGNEHVLLGTFPVGLAANDYAKFAILIEENAGEYNIVIVEDGLKVGEISGVTPVGDKIGNGMLLYAANNDWTLSDHKDGDVSAPYICVDTPLIYFLTEGDAVPEIGYRIFDRTNDPSSEVAVETIWDDGAKTGDKMNAGTWHALIRATDDDGNVSEKTITVNVYATVIKYVVKFNGKNATEYAEGSLIVKPVDPIKASTNKVVYVFDGWYNGNYKWDFVNDTVSSDVNLTAKFIETERLYKVTIIVGEEKYEVYAKYGAQPDLAMLEKSGYDIVLTVEGKEVEMISVTGDTTVNVSYAENKNKSDDTEKEKKSGCGSSLSSAYIAAPVLAVAIALILRKKERKDEE